MKPTDLGRLVWAGSPELSPDGEWIVYVLSRVDADANSYRQQLWIVRTDGTGSPRPLTSAAVDAANPCWHPDQSRIAYTTTTTDSPAVHSICLLPFDGPGEPIELVSGPEAYSELVFAPDGRQLAWVSRARSDDYDADKAKDRAPRQIDRRGFMRNGQGFIIDRPSHVYVSALDGTGPPVDLTPGGEQCSGPSWFPTSDRIAYAAGGYREHPFASFICAVATDRPGESHQLTELGLWVSPSVSPDGSQIAVVGHADTSAIGINETLSVIATDAAGPVEPREIGASVDRRWTATSAAQSPRWLDSSTVVSAIEDRGETHVYSASPDAGATLLVGAERTVTGWSLHGDNVAFSASTATEPADIYVSVGGTTRRLTSHGAPFVAAVSPRPPERFVVPTGDVEVDAWAFLPYDFDPAKRYPMLLNIHGGPFTQYGSFFFDEAQMQCREGYVVVMSNPRGSSGREAGWGTAVLGPRHKYAGSGWGGFDYDDLMAVTDAALARYDFIDPDRIGVLGGSYGGFMTSWIVTHTDRFAAACSERAVNNLLTLEYGSDIAGFGALEVGVSAFDAPDHYLEMSPISYVKNLATPLLIVHSEEDLRCPIEQADQLFNAAETLGIGDVEYWRFPGENHELSRTGSPTHRRQRAEIIHEFFNRWLKPST